MLFTKSALYSRMLYMTQNKSKYITGQADDILNK